MKATLPGERSGDAAHPHEVGFGREDGPENRGNGPESEHRHLIRCVEGRRPKYTGAGANPRI